MSLYRAAGERDSLFAMAEELVRRRPGDPAVRHAYATAALDTRRFELARDQNLESLRLSPDGWLRDEDTHTALTVRAYLLLWQGNETSARELFDRERERVTGLLDAGGDGHWLHWELGAIHAALRERDDAMSSMERAFEAGWREPGWARLDPLLDSLRHDSRFIDLIERADADLAAQRERVAHEETALGIRSTSATAGLPPLTP